MYAVPDDSGVGDQVMAALVLHEGAGLDRTGLARFLGEQSDLGTKSRPRLVRVATSLPQTPTHKVLERQLSAEGADGHADPVWVMPD